MKCGNCEHCQELIDSLLDKVDYQMYLRGMVHSEYTEDVWEKIKDVAEQELKETLKCE